MLADLLHELSQRCFLILGGQTLQTMKCRLKRLHKLSKLHSCYLLKLEQQPRSCSLQGLYTSPNLWLRFLQDRVRAQVLKARVSTHPTPTLTSRKVNITGPQPPSPLTKHTSPSRFSNKNHLFCFMQLRLPVQKKKN